MHTDEYEISLWRELKVCEGYVRAAQQTLDRMEARAEGGESLEWRHARESLARWSAARDEYAGLLGLMRQSAPR